MTFGICLTWDFKITVKLIVLNEFITFFTCYVKSIIENKLNTTKTIY